MNLIRLLDGDLVYVRSPFPMGQMGLKLERGLVTPRGQELDKLIATYGSAAKPGDLAHISEIIFRDHSIFFEINGGPVKKQKWYERIEVGGANGSPRPIKPSSKDANPQGSVVELVFDRPVPEMTVEQLKQLLRPVFDFDSKSGIEAYIETVTPKVREALKNHIVLVGMDRDMVLAAKGQPGRRIRETEGNTDYEEWIYGEPPQEVSFVRFLGDEVVRVETITVDGKKTVKTEKEVDVRPATGIDKDTEPQPSPGTSPSLHRPGEALPGPSTPAPGTLPPVPPSS
jgi:hypothetical protein